jgi:6-phosphofructokinase 1
MTKLWPHRAAVVFSGGDSPGMNAQLRAVVRLGRNRDEADVLGVQEGHFGLVRTARRIESGQTALARLIGDIDTYQGLPGVDRASLDVVRLDDESVKSALGRGRAMLDASRCKEFPDPAIRRRVVGPLAGLDTHAVSVRGGDGSLAGETDAGIACLERAELIQASGRYVKGS